MPGLPQYYLLGLGLAMTSKPEVNTCSNLSLASAPVCWGPSAPARKLSPHLPYAALTQTPRVGSLLLPFAYLVSKGWSRGQGGGICLSLTGEQ